MTNIDILNKKQEKELVRKHKDIPKNVKLVKIGKSIYAYTGNLNTQEINNLSRVARIESVGIYLFNIDST